MSPRATAAALLLAVACGGPDAPAPAAHDRAPAAPAVLATPASGAPVPAPPRATSGPAATPAAPAAAAPAPPRARLAGAERDRLREAITAGRRLAHAGDHAAALARLEEALALDPGSARLRCEAGFVAFEAGELDRADALVRVALAALGDGTRVDEEHRVPIAMCLYNAALVHEARGRLDGAREALRRSITLRPNATASARLAALDAREPETGDGPAPAPRALPDGASFDEVARVLRDEFCAEGNGGFERDDLGSCEALGIAATPVAGGAPGGIEAAIVGGDHVSERYGGRVLYRALAVRAGGRLLVAELADGYSPGIDGMTADVAVRARYDDVLPGLAPELVVTVEASTADADMGSCDYRYGRSAATIVCSTDGGALACAYVAHESSYVEEHEPCDDVWGEEAGDDRAPDEARREAEGFRTTVRFENGRVLFDRDATFPEPGPDPSALRELLTRPEEAWPASWWPYHVYAG